MFPLKFLPELKQKFIIILLIFAVGCSKGKKTEERLFLENVMIRNGGLYVLMGSKPMIDFPIDSGYPETAEECAEDYQEYRTRLKEEGSEASILSYDQYSALCNRSIHHHTRKLWEEWEKKMQEFVGPCYRFVALKTFSSTQKRIGLFLNVPNTLFVLKQYYPEFVQAAGAPFDPAQVIDEISNEDSPFWSRVFQSDSYVIGLLLGYGRRNSFVFDWESKNHLFLPRYSDVEKNIKALRMDNIDVANLPLPGFCVFSLGDEMMENYKLQREQIIKEFRGKNFEEIVKQWLGMGRAEKYEMKSMQ